MRLGKREIGQLACPPDRADIVVFDDRITGFAVRVTRSGAKIFFLQYRAGGRVRRLRLGRYGDITPDQARRLAAVRRGEIAAGKDPVADQRRCEQDAVLTFGKLAARWAVQGLKSRRPRYRAEAERALQVNFEQIRDGSASAITPAAAQNAIDRIAATRGDAMARRSCSYARAAFNWAVARNLVAVNPFARIVLESREIPRDRVLSDAELGEVWRATGTLGWPMGPFIRLLLLTLQRVHETAGLRWDELAADRSTWQIPASRAKNDRAHLVHLSEPARALLAELPRLSGSPLAFTTTGKTPISGLSKAKERLDAAILAERQKRATETPDREAEPLQPWRLHDFRRTGVTALAARGVRREVADRVLNHVTGAIQGIAAVYQKHAFLEERKAALETWAAHVLTTAKGRPGTSSVVDIRVARRRKKDRAP